MCISVNPRKSVVFTYEFPRRHISVNPHNNSTLHLHSIVPDLGVMWDGMAITFAKMGLRDFFLDAKRSVYVFLVQS